MASPDKDIICNLLPAFPDLSIQGAWYLRVAVKRRHGLMAGTTIALVWDSLPGAAW